MVFITIWLLNSGLKERITGNLQLATGETVAGGLIFVPFALLVYGVEPIPLSDWNLIFLFSG